MFAYRAFERIYKLFLCSNCYCARWIHFSNSTIRSLGEFESVFILLKFKINFDRNLELKGGGERALVFIFAIFESNII